MKKTSIIIVILAVIMAAACPLWGQEEMGGVIEDANGPVNTEPITEGEQPNQGDRTHLEIAAQNFNTLEQQLVSGTRPTDEVCDDIVNETKKMNIYLTQRNIINQGLNPGQMIALLEGLGYEPNGSGGATWGRSDVARALDERVPGTSQFLLVGRNRGTTPDSAEWQSWLTKQEFAVGMMRTLDAAKAYAKAYTDQAIGIHENNPNAHPAMVKALEVRIAEGTRRSNLLALIAALLALAAIILAIIAMRRRNAAAAAAQAAAANNAGAGNPGNPGAGGNNPGPPPAPPVAPMQPFQTNQGSYLAF